MKPTVYIETTVPSYLTAWPSRDLTRAAEQQWTRDWWKQRDQYELRVSTLVLQECDGGDKDAAADRRKALQDVPILETNETAGALASKLMLQVPLPEKATADALHIAIAAVNGMEFLVTWNCRHIANAVLRPRIEDICRAAGYEPPVICTPAELLGEHSHE